MYENFNINCLEERIKKIKKDSEPAIDFTLEFLRCLLERHDLEVSIPEDIENDQVPSIIYETLRQGELPSKEQIMLMDMDTQTNFILNLLLLCGLNALSYYTSDEGSEFFDGVIAMLDVNAGHVMGCYLISALTLLQSSPPSIEFVASLTNEFDDSVQNLSKMNDYFLDLSMSILLRWREDHIYYGNK